MKKINNIQAVCFLLPVLLLIPFYSAAQNVTSPYSILGIGDIDTKDFGRYFSSGNAAIARRDAASYNFSNPASLTSLPFKNMHLDIAMRGRTSTFSSPGEDTSTSATKDFIIKRVTMAFKINEKTGIAFGLRPYSSVNYKFQRDQLILDGNTSYTRLVDGSGGINQFYLSAGTMLNKRLSAGITASWLFGSLQKSTEYTGSSISLDVIKQQTDFYYGALFQGGLQYYSLPGKKWRHQLGLTGSVSTGLSGELTTEYSENSTSIKKNTETGRTFQLPVTVGIGYAAVKNDQLTLSVEGNYCHWPYQKVDYVNSYTAPSVKLSAGLDYSFKKKQSNYAYEKSYVSCGINLENSYIKIKNANLWDYSFSVGGGLSIARNLSAYTGIEFGSKGDKAADQIKEKYTQYILGITLKDIWISFKRFGRYN